MRGYAVCSVAFRLFIDHGIETIVRKKRTHCDSGRVHRASGWRIGCRLLLLIVGVAFANSVTAQDADTTTYPVWDIDLTSRLNGSQAGYQNWTEGGINSLAAATQLNGAFKRTSANWLQQYETRLAIGIVKQDTLSVRKAEDIIRLKGQISYTGENGFQVLSPTVAVGVRTQFAPGSSYDKNPFGDDRQPPVKVSDFFSPATFTQSLGLGYNTDAGFTQRVGVAAKETVVLIQRLRMLYGHDASEAVRFQLGLESQSELDREIFTNVRVKSSLGLFAAFNQEELPDLLWENQVIMKINSWLSAEVELVTLYDRDISDAVQIKEVFSLGISIDFI